MAEMEGQSVGKPMSNNVVEFPEPVKEMRRWDRVMFKYAFNVHQGTILQVSEQYGMIRIRFWPWPIFGTWVDRESYHEHIVIGRSWIGKLLDWKNKDGNATRFKAEDR